MKRPIDKQTIRCLNSLVKRSMVTPDAETETMPTKCSRAAFGNTRLMPSFLLRGFDRV